MTEYEYVARAPGTPRIEGAVSADHLMAAVRAAKNQALRSVPHTDSSRIELIAISEEGSA